MRAVTNNLLLAQLGTAERRALLAGTQPVTLRAGEPIFDVGKLVARVIFPIECSVSLMSCSAGQPLVEAGLIGREGMLGLSLLFGVSVSAFRAVVQGPGRAWCLEPTHFTAQLAHNAALRQRLHRYVYVRLLQLAQSSACMGIHRIEGRLARWLLMSRDRARSGELALTHEELASILGVRRAGVTIAASALQERGLIRYARGHIEVLDDFGLEAAACPCYTNEIKIYARLMR